MHQVLLCGLIVPTGTQAYLNVEYFNFNQCCFFSNNWLSNQHYSLEREQSNVLSIQRYTNTTNRYFKFKPKEQQMNYTPLMQQLPPMPMSSNYPSGPHEQNSAPSGGPPAQYSPVMHGMAQSAHAVSQSNYMLQSNAAAASLSNNNLCNDFGPKSQRCSNIAMVQGGCMNTNMNSMHQGAPNYSNINGVSSLVSSCI